MRASLTLFIVAVLATMAAACESGEPEAPTFEAVVERVIAPSCTFSSCHTAPTNAAALDLTPERACNTLVNQPSCLFPDRMRIVPGSPEQSFFFQKLAGQGLHETPTGDCGHQSNLLMPFGASALAAEDLDLVHGWIAAGASCSGEGTPEKPSDTEPVIASVTASRAAPLAGETVTVTVTLDKAAPEGGMRVAIEMESAAVSAPVSVVVPASETAVKFDAYAMRPTSRFVLRTRTTTSTKDLMLRVTGLEVAEVMADPVGADDQLQWVKLHNTSSLPIDLNGYRLRAGQGNYDLVAVELSGTIPAGACAVIGGPTVGGANAEPIFLQPVDFSPDIPYTGNQAVGIGVFDGSAPAVAGVTTPVDAMLIGVSNEARLLGPDAEAPTPYCGTPLAGTSALRTGATSCVQALMQPRTCP